MKKFLFLLFTGVLALNTLSASSKDGYTEIVYIIDDSHYMKGVEDDVIKGFNSMLAEQKGKEDKVIISIVLFSGGTYTLYNRANIRDVEDITRIDYIAGGNAALYDAIGTTIIDIGKHQLVKRENKRAKKLLFVIMTNGVVTENEVSSASDIRELIQGCKAEYGWDFMFLASNNVDVKVIADSIGIPEDRAVGYMADAQGVKIMNESISSVLSSLRQGEEISVDWKDRVADDYRLRVDQLDFELDSTTGLELKSSKDKIDKNVGVVYATFRGGDKLTFRRWMMSRVKYPIEAYKNSLEARVTIAFIVERDGSVGRAKVFGAPHESFVQEIIKVLDKSPKWTPAMRDGKASCMRLTMNYNFKL